MTKLQGLTKNTQKNIEAISLLPSIKDFLLIGGTALSLQIAKRQSEDLDFCKWSTNLKKDNFEKRCFTKKNYKKGC